jgi:hypothetical protein
MPMSPEAVDNVPLAPSEPSGAVSSETFTAYSNSLKQPAQSNAEPEPSQVISPSKK